MFRHTGTRRTYRHNVSIATLLSLNAGFTNAAGFLGFSVLTTNVTGHAAFFAERLVMEDWKASRVIALWMMLFLGGAFCSSLIMNHIGRNRRFSYVIPLLLEIIVFLLITLFGYRYHHSLVAREIFAGSLLFIMGMQNALVTMVSGAQVRTTHLTGTFTDLGIELAQLYKKRNMKDEELYRRVKLRGIIIFGFLSGALAGAYLFHYFNYYAFIVPVALLLFALFYDIFRIHIKRYYHRPSHRGG